MQHRPLLADENAAYSMSVTDSTREVIVPAKSGAAYDNIVDDTPIMHHFSYRVIKRIVDIILAALGLVILSPLLLLIAILLKQTSRGSILH